VAQLKSYPASGHITELACEEGWSYIAEWNGVPLSHVLDVVGVQPQAKYVVYVSMEPDTWDSIDMDEARHPQTLIAYGMNDNELTVAHGGPLRIRVPRQLGYKNVKFVNHLTVTDDIKKFGKDSVRWHRSSDTSGLRESKEPICSSCCSSSCGDHVEAALGRRIFGQFSQSLFPRSDFMALLPSKAPGPRLESNFDDYARI